MRYRLIVATLFPTLGALMVVWAWHLLYMSPDWISRYLIEPLESRYQRPSAISEEDFTGIITLSGTNYPSRFAEAGRLARLYPKLKVLLSDQTDVAEGLAKLGGGIDPSRLILETGSTNTYENAIFGAALVKPQPEDRWLLVTSALHMPRAMACFQAAGFHIEAWPMYDGAATEPPMIASAIHEWVGLLAYRLLGRTVRFFPE